MCPAPAPVAPPPPSHPDVPTPPGWPTDGSDRRSSKQMRVHVVTHDAIAAIATLETRAWVDELDLVVNAGLKALGYPALPTLAAEGE